MECFRIKITETYAYEIDVVADNPTQAIKRAKEYYSNPNDGYTGVANSDSFEKARFKLMKKN